MVVSVHGGEGWFWELSGQQFEQGWKVPSTGHYTLSLTSFVPEVPKK